MKWRPIKRRVLWKKAYIGEDGLKYFPIKVSGKKRYRCDDCGKKVRETFRINPCEILLRRELCRECYCKTPESLQDLFRLFDGEDFK